jgi:hypothetical protein
MMKLWIPKCGDAIELTEEWKFDLMHEYRNEEAIRAFAASAPNKTP